MCHFSFNGGIIVYFIRVSCIYVCCIYVSMKPESRTVCWVIVDLWTGL